MDADAIIVGRPWPDCETQDLGVEEPMRCAPEQYGGIEYAGSPVEV